MKQRWRIFPRFGLRSILVLTTCVAILCGRWLIQAQRQRDASEQLTALGVSLHMEDPPVWLRWLPEKVLNYDGGHFFCPVTEAEFLVVQPPSPIQLLAKLPRLRLLRLDRWSLGSDGLAGLAGCSQLESLDLSMQDFDNEDLSRLPRLPRLKSLDLSYNCKCSMANLDLPQLESLDLSNTHVNDATLKQVARLTRLRRLNLNSTRVTDEGIASLKALENLESLNLYSTDSTGFGIASIRSLKSLVVSHSFLENRHFAEICEMPNLEDLDVGGCREITDDSIAHLVNKTTLKSLDLSNCRRISQNAVDTLAQIPMLSCLQIQRTGVTSLSKFERLRKLEYLNHSVSEVEIEQLLSFPEAVRSQITGASSRSPSKLVLEGVVGLCAEHLSNFDPDVEHLSLAGSRFESDVLWKLASWPNIRSLNLEKSSITNEDLAAIATMTNLRSLRLNDTVIDDIGLLQLVSLSQLEELSLTNTQVSQASMGLISGFSNLKTLKLPFVLEPESLLKLLADCQSLVGVSVEKSAVSFPAQIKLELGDLRLTARQLDRLFSLRSFVTVKSSALSDEECKSIVSNSDIHALDLNGSPITDAGVEILSSRESWNYLDLTNTKVTPDGIRLLCKSPNRVGRLVYDGGLDASAFVKAVPDLNSLGSLCYPLSRLSVDDARKFLTSCWKHKIKVFDFERRSEPVKVEWMLGECAYDSDVWRLSLPGPLIDNDKLLEFKPSMHLEEVSASGVSCNPELLIDRLAACPNLQTLTLDRVPLSFNSIEKLKDLKRLYRLELTDCGLDDSHLRKLAELTQVFELILDSNQIQGERLDCFENSMHLDLLSLKDNPLTENARRTAQKLERRLQVLR